MKKQPPTPEEIHACRVEYAAAARAKGKAKFQYGMIWLRVEDYPPPDPFAAALETIVSGVCAHAIEADPGLPAAVRRASLARFTPALTRLAGQGSLFRPAMGDLPSRTEIESRRARRYTGQTPDFFAAQPNPQPRAQKGPRS